MNIEPVRGFVRSSNDSRMAQNIERYKRYIFLGLWSNLLEPNEIIDIYGQAIKYRDRFLVGSVNLHTAYCHKRSQEVQEFFRIADIVYVDGMPIVWWLKCLRYPAKARHRATFADWLPTLFSTAHAEGWRIFFLGNRPGVTDRVAVQFRARHPGLMIDTAHGHFDLAFNSKENQAIIQRINDFAPHILLVGMGMPIQERWIVENAARLNALVIHRCGATADLFAGEIPFPPRILGRLGLEGVCRLLIAPKRLWFRYLVEPWLLLDLALSDLRRRVRRNAGSDGTTEADCSAEERAP